MSPRKTFPGQPSLVVLSIAAVLASGPVSADRNWIGGSGFWEGATQWGPSGLPGGGESAFLTFSDGTHRTVVVGAADPLGSYDLNSLVIDATGIGTVQLVPEGADLFTTETTVGLLGAATYRQRNGSHVTDHLLVGGESGSNGTYLYEGGVLTSQSATVGAVAGASGTVALQGAGANWSNVGTIEVGVLGNGAVRLEDGAEINAAAVLIGATGELSGNGQVTADVSNSGLFGPG